MLPDLFRAHSAARRVRRLRDEGLRLALVRQASLPRVVSMRKVEIVTVIRDLNVVAGTDGEAYRLDIWETFGKT